MVPVGTTYNKEEKIWCGPEIQQLYHPDVSVGQIILEALTRSPSKVSQISDGNGSRLTNNDLRLRSIRIARKLLNTDLQQGDVIGIVARNTENLAGIVFAALCCGFPINALDPAFGNDEILHMYGCTRPKIIFCDVSQYEKVKECVGILKLKAPIWTINGRTDSVGCVEDLLVPTGDEDVFIPPKLTRGGDEIATMVCTSGTTGNSKAVCLSHGTFIAQYRNLFHGTYDDVVFITSPLYWMTCWMCLLHCSVAGATRVITDEPFSPELLFKIVEKYKVTIVLTAPTFMMTTANSPSIDQADLSSVKIFLCTGCSLPDSQINRMNSHLPNGCLIGAYGMSEISCYVTIEEPSTKKNGSVGKLVSNTKVKIIDDCGNKLGINEEGEILIKILKPFSGYFSQPDDTKYTLDEDGWVHSADIGYFNEEGYLFLKDRKKDLIKHKSYHVSPSEVESLLLTLKGEQQACVVGIPHEMFIELPAAAIVKSRDIKLSEKEVYDFIASQTSAHKHLQGGVYFVESLPLTPSGKVVRRKVRDCLIELYNKLNSKLIL